jgi:hypothetical protein
MTTAQRSIHCWFWTIAGPLLLVLLVLILLNRRPLPTQGPPALDSPRAASATPTAGAFEGIAPEAQS